jgi:hypothetical protein
MSKLYLTEASRYDDQVLEAITWYSGKHLTIASNQKEAGEKLIDYLNKHTRYRSWEVCQAQELTKETDISLEKRVEILTEIFPVL